MKFQHILGTDLSKKTIDVFCHSTSKHCCIENNNSGFKSLLKWLKEQNLSLSETAVVMEHTGLYTCLFALRNK